MLQLSAELSLQHIYFDTPRGIALFRRASDVVNRTYYEMQDPTTAPS
jgi:hypothetical protein